MIDISDFNYTLPLELIADHPTSPRDSSRLMLVNRSTRSISHHLFSDLPTLLPKESTLIFNETKVIPARLYGVGEKGKKHEIFLTRKLSNDSYEAMITPGINIGSSISLSDHIKCIVTSQLEKVFTINFTCDQETLNKYIEQFGHTPLPHYIGSKMSEVQLRESYQTVYASHAGSVAAPTAGLHFTKELIEILIANGITIEKILLHVSLGTFAPINEKNILSKSLHPEIYQVGEIVSQKILKSKKSQLPIIAVGTTTARTLETVAKTHILEGETSIFIYPPYKFELVDGLITNFHLPKSSLLMLVTAFASSPNTESPFTDFRSSIIFQAYMEAIRLKYRFYSFGDAMLIM